MDPDKNRERTGDAEDVADDDNRRMAAPSRIHLIPVIDTPPTHIPLPHTGRSFFNPKPNPEPHRRSRGCCRRRQQPCGSARRRRAGEPLASSAMSIRGLPLPGAGALRSTNVKSGVEVCSQLPARRLRAGEGCCIPREYHTRMLVHRRGVGGTSGCAMVALTGQLPRTNRPCKQTRYIHFVFLVEGEGARVGGWEQTWGEREDVDVAQLMAVSAVALVVVPPRAPTDHHQTRRVRAHLSPPERHSRSVYVATPIWRAGGTCVSRSNWSDWSIRSINHQSEQQAIHSATRWAGSRVWGLGVGFRM